MKGIKSAAFAAVCMVMLVGFRYPTRLAPVVPPVTLPATFIDQRPPKQLKSGFESLMITNCAYGSLRIGDEDIEPDLPMLLAAMLGERFGEQLHGKVISLQAFTLHLNNVAALRKQVGSMYTGLIPNMLNKQDKIGCAPDDIRGGYTAGEVPQDKFPLIVAIDMQIDGQPFHARAIAPVDFSYPPRKNADPQVKEQWNAAAGDVVQAALARLGNDIGQKLFGALALDGTAGDVPQASQSMSGTVADVSERVSEEQKAPEAEPVMPATNDRPHP